MRTPAWTTSVASRARSAALHGGALAALLGVLTLAPQPALAADVADDIAACVRVDPQACPALQSAAASRKDAIGAIAKRLAAADTPAGHKAKLAQALASLDARDHLEALQTAAAAMTQGADRVDVRMAQARLGDERASPDLQLALKSTDLRSRLLAAGGLGLLRSKDAVPALIAAVGDGSAGRLQAEACRALGSIGDAAALQAILDLAASPVAYPPARAEALRALARLGSPHAGVLAAMLADHASRDVANAAMTVLQARWQPWTTPAVLMALETPGRRAVAARLAADRIGAEAGPKLMAAVGGGDLDAEERVYVLDALAVIKPVGAAAALVKRLTKAARDEQIEILQLLPKLGDRTIVPDLVPYLGDADNQIVSHAVYALENLTNQRLGPDIKAWRKYAGLDAAGNPKEAPKAPAPRP